MDNTYGTVNKPSSFGSGNGNSTGGGIIKLNATGTMHVDGSIVANGQSPGGSGGSIYLVAASFSGRGTVSAKGGNGADSYGMCFLKKLYSSLSTQQ